MALIDTWKEPGEFRKKSGGPSWTVMIFMGAESIGDSASLDRAVKDDLKEIGKVGGGGKHGLDIFVEVHGVEVPHRHHFGSVNEEKAVEFETPVPISPLDYQDGRALLSFIESSLLRVGHRPEDRTMVILWGHAYDFAFGRALSSDGSVAALDFAEISGVLQTFQTGMLAAQKQQYPGRNDELPKVDLIGFDSCDVATVEMAYQLQPFAKFMLGSEIGIPVPGFPYNLIFDRLKYPHGDLMAAPEFGSYAVRRYCASYEASSPVTLTLLNLEHVRQLSELTEGLAVELALAIQDPATRSAMIDLFSECQTEAGKPFVDAADLCLNLLGSKRYPDLSRRARDLGDHLAGPRPNVVGRSKLTEGWPLVAEHCRNSGELVRLNGLSLYAPHVAPPDDFHAVKNLYQKLKFAKDTHWSHLVHDLATSV